MTLSRTTTVALSVVAALVLSLLLAPPPRADAAGEQFTEFASGFSTPLLVTAPDGDARVFVAERAGRIVVLHPDGTRETFLDIRTMVGTDGEGGLLGVAFSPEYASDGRVYVHYTNTAGDTRVDRYTVSADPDRASPGSRTNVLSVAQPASNHNGGTIAFTRDGMLLVALGDGGGSNDTYDNAQDTSTLLGSLLRLDVLARAGSGYAIPADNPFVGRSGRDEIWAYGLRNPYRASVDRETGEVWIGDVGQGAREEVDRLPAAPSGPVNLGWPEWEGTRCNASSCSATGVTFPVYEYDHSGSICSVVGGHVVRSSLAQGLSGQYVFGDFCAGWIRAYDPATDTVTELGQLPILFSFGEDGRGHVYAMDASTLYRLEGSGTRFADVSSSSVYAGAIERIADAGITRGCNPPTNDRFCPTDPVGRDQMASFVTRLLALPGRTPSFTDVSTTSPHRGAIGAIQERGITRGCNPPENTRFCPTSTITRAEVAVLITRALDLPLTDDPFTDVPDSSQYAPYIGAIAQAGLVRGCNPPDNTRYCPDDPLTREQMAVILSNALSYVAAGS